MVPLSEEVNYSSSKQTRNFTHDGEASSLGVGSQDPVTELKNLTTNFFPKLAGELAHKEVGASIQALLKIIKWFPLNTIWCERLLLYTGHLRE